MANRIVFLNCAILTTDGTFALHTISHDAVLKTLEECKDWERLSAIGHDATATIMTSLLGEQVLVNRIRYQQECGDLALVFCLKGRIPEGKILNIEEINAIGFEWKILDKISNNPMA